MKHLGEMVAIIITSLFLLAVFSPEVIGLSAGKVVKTYLEYMD